MSAFNRRSFSTCPLTSTMLTLGTLRLAPYLLPRDRVEPAKANGVCFDYKKHYGEPPPDLAHYRSPRRGKDVKIPNLQRQMGAAEFLGLKLSGLS